MIKLKYDADSMKLMSLFESMTGAKVKDCILDERLIIIVEENEMGKAIGRNGVNIKRLEHMMKKKVKLVEFSKDLAQFIKNLAHPIEISNIENDDGKITLFGKDTSTRAMLIGRERQNINHMKEIAQRYFDVKEIKVM